MEQFTDLTIQECNFRDILQEHLAQLLAAQKTYWKKRGAIKWIRFGDENTKFLNANATLKFRRCHIPVLRDANGVERHGHHEKADLLWNSYKERLGTSDFIIMLFNLDELIEPVDDLIQLQELFLKDEIDIIVVNLPTNKSPCPDGFNGDFLKKCWAVVSADFYALCEDFFHHSYS